MKETTVNPGFKENPVLLEKVLQDLQKSLKERIPWLDNAFGRAYKLVEHRPDGDKFVYPAMYNGKGEYVSLMPNDRFGNFSWFDIYDPQRVTQRVPALPNITVDGALVFWYDLGTIYDDDSVLHTEEVKDEILQVLTTPGLIASNGSLRVNELKERFENIYDGYSIEKIYNEYTYKGDSIQDLDRQFFMYPYAGLRVEFTLTTKELCIRNVR